MAEWTMAPDCEKQMSRKQAALGVAKAIQHYTSLGCAVFIPVSDMSRYDIVVDDGDGLKRVEVKTTSAKDVSLRTMGGNSSWNGEVKRISSLDCDIVFAYNVVTESFKVFSSQELEGRSTVRV